MAYRQPDSWLQWDQMEILISRASSNQVNSYRNIDGHNQGGYLRTLSYRYVQVFC